MKKPLGLNKSFIISTCFHILFLTLIMLTLSGRPVVPGNEAVTVSIEPLGESISKGLEYNIYEPVVKVNEKHENRRTKQLEKNTIPDRTEALNESPQENIKKNIIADSEGQLNRETGDTNKNKSLQEKLSEEISKEEAQEKINKEMKDIFGALEQGTPSGNKSKELSRAGDPLGDASWSSRPRRTTFFPDIQSKIPEKYKEKGLSYSVTVKLTFDKNGLASGAEIITSSGDPAIDSIFSMELRKVRVEPINEDRIDQIVKVFKISLK